VGLAAVEKRPIYETRSRSRTSPVSTGRPKPADPSDLDYPAGSNSTHCIASTDSPAIHWQG